MGREQIQRCFIWWSCIYLFKRGTRTGEQDQREHSGVSEENLGTHVAFGSIIYSCVSSNMSPPSFLTPGDPSLKHRRGQIILTSRSALCLQLAVKSPGRQALLTWSLGQVTWTP